MNFGRVHCIVKSGVTEKSSYLLLLLKLSNVIANNVDPDQMPHSAASDLVLHCLPMSLLWDAWHIWVKVPITYNSSRSHSVIFSLRPFTWKSSLIYLMLDLGPKFCSLQAQLIDWPWDQCHKLWNNCWSSSLKRKLIIRFYPHLPPKI